MAKCRPGTHCLSIGDSAYISLTFFPAFPFLLLFYVSIASVSSFLPFLLFPLFFFFVRFADVRSSRYRLFSPFNLDVDCFHPAFLSESVLPVSSIYVATRTAYHMYLSYARMLVSGFIIL